MYGYYGFEDDDARGISHDWEREQDDWDTYCDEEYHRRKDDGEL